MLINWDGDHFVFTADLVWTEADVVNRLDLRLPPLDGNGRKKSLPLR